MTRAASRCMAGAERDARLGPSIVRCRFSSRRLLNPRLRSAETVTFSFWERVFRRRVRTFEMGYALCQVRVRGFLFQREKWPGQAEALTP
jgi:hypothetical protein